jgi:hypothetical protein
VTILRNTGQVLGRQSWARICLMLFWWLHWSEGFGTKTIEVKHHFHGIIWRLQILSIWLVTDNIDFDAWGHVCQISVVQILFSHSALFLTVPSRTVIMLRPHLKDKHLVLFLFENETSSIHQYKRFMSFSHIFIYSIIHISIYWCLFYTIVMLYSVYYWLHYSIFCQLSDGYYVPLT